MEILVTGGSGFIGRHLIRILAGRGDTVHVLCRDPRALASDVPREVALFTGDILDTSSLDNAIAGCDAVFHLAGYARNWARNPETFFEVNVGGTRNVLAAAARAGVRRAVFTSTVMTIGPSGRTPIDESAQRTAPLLTDYERSKLEAEKEANGFVRRGLEVVTVNPTRVFGPGLLNEGNSATRMIKLFIEGKWRIVPGDGEALGNYAFVHDVAHGHILAMENGRTGERYILGGENLSYNELFAAISRLTGRRRWTLNVPAPLALAAGHMEELRATLFRGHPEISPPWVRTFLGNWAFSCAKAKEDIGYRITPFEEAMRRTLDWLEGERS